MKSSKCLFSKTVFKSDLKRFLPFAVPLLIAEIIIFPIVIMNAGYNRHPYPLEIGDFVEYSAVSSGFAFVFAGVMALLVFSYLYSPNKCNALHAFPIGRKALFLTHFASGYLLLVIPQVIGFAAGIPVIAPISKETGAIIALQCAAIFGESLVYFALAVFAVMLAANLFAGAVIYLMLSFAYTVFSAMLDLAVTSFGYGIIGTSYDNIITAFLSPVEKLITDKVVIGLSGQKEYHSDLPPVSQYYLSLLVLVIAAVVVTVLAHLLYKARSLECAGDMVAFKAEIPVLTVIVSVLGGACFAAPLSSILEFETVGMLVTYGIFSLLLFFAAQMILKKSAKVFQPKQFILWAVACGLSVALALGLAHYETNLIPAIGRVESVTVNATYDMELTDKADVELAEKLHALMIEKRNVESPEEPTESVRDYVFDLDDDAYDAYDDSYTLELHYTLKSGRIIYRAYYCDGKDEEITALVDKLEAAHQPQTFFERLADYDLVIKSVQIEDYSHEEYEEIYLNTSEFDTVYQLCAADAAAIAKDYRTSRVSGYRDDIYRVNFECAVQKEEDLKAIEALSQSDDVSGVSVYTDYVADGKTVYLTMDVNDDTPGVKAYLEQRSGS